ncbi:MAG: peptide chain release factor 2 [Pseudomonadota bacterium]
MLSDVQERFKELEKRLDDLRGIFDIEGMSLRLRDTEKSISKPGFWDDQEKAQTVLKGRKSLQNLVDQWEKQKKNLEDIRILLELVEEEGDEETAAEIEMSLDGMEKEAFEMEVRRMLGGGNDLNSAIVSIHAGAGGTEAQDWAEMLLRMYLRWAESRGFGTEMIDYQGADEAGLKSVTFTVEGDYSYGLLKAEIGIHRLVRISPFDAGGRRHTSFASVFVYPDIEDEIDVEINEDDLRIDTFRASGAGGQHVNRTDSAVRITHLPTGTVVQCQNLRSQHKNKAMAMKVLKSRLYELELKKKAEKMNELHSTKKEIAWGSQIRSYILHPYRMVKDHRTNREVGNVDAVLDGDIDQFIEAFLLANSNSSVSHADPTCPVGEGNPGGG